MEAVFLSVFNMSVAACWLILAVLPLRFLLNKAPKPVMLALWAMAGLRLALPFSVKSALSLTPSAQTVPPEILYSQTPHIHSGIAALNTYANPIIENSLAPELGASVNPAQIAAFLASLLWLSGIAAMLLYGLVSYLRLRRGVASGVLLAGNVYQSEAAGVPFILGVLRPRIYVPFCLDEDQLTHVLTHERAHIRHLDHIWKPLGFAVLALHWFNPLVWLAYLLFCRDIELACDERAVRTLPVDGRKAYSAALLSLGIKRTPLAVCPLAFGETGVKQRIRRVLTYRKPTFWILLVSLLCFAALAVFFLTNPSEKTDDPLAAYEGVKLSEMTQSECAAFVRDSGIEIPPGLENDALGRFAKSLFASFEENPYGPPAAVSYAETLALSQRIRRAVIRHYDLPWLRPGVYEFEECLYMNPLSSYFPPEGTGYVYCVGEDFFRTAEQEGYEGRERYPALEAIADDFPYWNVEAIPADVWSESDSLLEPDMDLEKYAIRLKFTGAGTNGKTALFLMDDDLWLVRLGEGPVPVWRIYKLRLTDLKLADFTPEA